MIIYKFNEPCCANCKYSRNLKTDEKHFECECRRYAPKDPNLCFEGEHLFGLHAENRRSRVVPFSWCGEYEKKPESPEPKQCCATCRFAIKYQVSTSMENDDYVIHHACARHAPHQAWSISNTNKDITGYCRLARVAQSYWCGEYEKGEPHVECECERIDTKEPDPNAPSCLNCAHCELYRTGSSCELILDEKREYPVSKPYCRRDGAFAACPRNYVCNKYTKRKASKGEAKEGGAV